MKRVFPVCLLLCITCKLFCQYDTATPQPALHTDYLKKSKNQKTTAWILLGAGVTMNIIGLSQFNFAGTSDAEGTERKNNTAVALFIGGVIADAVSIPFFIASSRNKRKALHATVNFGLSSSQGMYAYNGQGIQYKTGIKLSF